MLGSAVNTCSSSSCYGAVLELRSTKAAIARKLGASLLDVALRLEKQMAAPGAETGNRIGFHGSPRNARSLG